MGRRTLFKCWVSYGAAINTLPRSSLSLSVSRKKKNNTWSASASEIANNNRGKNAVDISFRSRSEKKVWHRQLIDRNLCQMLNRLPDWSLFLISSFLFFLRARAATYFQVPVRIGRWSPPPPSTLHNILNTAECVCVCVCQKLFSERTVLSCHRRLLPPPHRTDIIDVCEELGGEGKGESVEFGWRARNLQTLVQFLQSPASSNSRVSPTCREDL